jgi:hypothetical protein
MMILIVPLLLFTQAKINPPAALEVPAINPMMSAAVPPIASFTRILDPFLTGSPCSGPACSMRPAPP